MGHNNNNTSEWSPPVAKNASEVARFFDVARSTVHDWINKGMPRPPCGLDKIVQWREAVARLEAGQPAGQVARQLIAGRWDD